MLIQILTPLGDNHKKQYWLSLLKFQQYAYQNDIEIAFRHNSMSNIYYARELLLKKSIEETPEYDYILWVDADAVFEPKDIERLISLDLDIVGGCARFKSDKGVMYNFGNYCPQAWEDLNICMVNSRATDELPEEPFEVDYTGCHFLLMKKGVAESIKFPRFPLTTWGELDERVKNAQGYMSEDGAFCFKLKQAGYKIMIDPLTQIGHVKELIL